MQRRGSEFRKHWQLAPDVTFLNHGSFGACPKAVLKLQSELRLQMESEPVQFLWRHYEDRLERSRATVARFVGARSKDLVFTTNATAGVNAVCRSVGLRRGDEVLTTSLDYNACRNALAEAAKSAGAKLVISPIPFPLQSGDEIIEAVLSKTSQKTRLAMLDHVTSSSGMILPIEQLVRELESRGIDTLVDGAHAPGMLLLNLKRLRPAYYTANLHKWVCAPKGAAFLWVREDKQERMQPPVVSHGNNTHRPNYSPFQDRFDWCGTFDPTAWFCAGPTIAYMESLVPGGWKAIRKRNHELALAARSLLAEKLQVELPCPTKMIGAMATLPLPKRFQNARLDGKIDPEQLRLRDEFLIEVPLLRIGNPAVRHLRISAQLYNCPQDYEKLAKAIHAL